jgi:hypothetical protein
VRARIEADQLHQQLEGLTELKTFYTIAVALGLALGAATQASATPNCTKTSGGHSCTVPEKPGVKFNVATSSQATAVASVVAALNNQQAQQQSQTSVNTNVNSNTATGGNASIDIGDTFIAPAINGGDAHWCYSLPTGGMCVPLKSVMIQNRVNLVDQCFAKAGKAYVACIAMIDDLPQIKRALKQAGVYGN